jgi:hypothetical protein
MNTIFKKLQFKDFNKIYVLNAPPEFKPHLEEMAEFTLVKKSPNCKQKYEFALFFVKSCDEIIKYAELATNKLNEDALLWFAYPKKSSRKYKSDISRDSGWQPLGDLGFEGVRMIAIDDDWSALRLRQAKFIKSLSRDPKRVMSSKGNSRSL